MKQPSLSIIIPIAQDENQWQHLCQNFDLLSEETEIILAAVEGEDLQPLLKPFQQQFPKLAWKLIYSSQGRAIQMNHGAAQADKDFLWFLHADCQITEHNIQQFKHCLKQQGSNRALFYFDLYFYDKPNQYLKLNELGAKFRSDILRLPFGDQGFFLSKECFHELGRYNPNVPYGEDHLLVWQAKHQKIPLKRCPSRLATSARKYTNSAWKLTLKYQILWPKQAWPQFLKWIKNRFPCS